MRIAVTLVAMAVFVVHALHYTAAWSDDAFITFRYAQHVARGLGPVFNPGERVEGITNLGYALLLAPFAVGDLLAASRAFGLASGLGTVALLASWGRRLTLPATCAVLAVFVCTPWAPSWTMMGLETAPAMFLATAAWARRSGVATALGPWIRPDLALLAVLTPRDRASLALLVVSALTLVVAKLYWFGAILPHTFHVRAGNLAEGLSYLHRFVSVPSPLIPGLVFVAAAFGVFRRQVPSVLWLAWVVAVVLQGGDFMANFRFLVPAWPAACAGVGFLADALLRRFPGPATTAGLASVLAVALVAPLRLLRADELNRIGTTPFQPEKLAPFFAPWRSPEWAAGLSQQMPFAAAWSLVNLRADAAVAYTDIGMLSYVYEGRVVDILGLTDPMMARGGAEAARRLTERATVLISDDGRWEEGWTSIDACDLHRVYRNPALEWERPSDAEIAPRLDRVLRIAPRHYALHLAIARELNHAGSGLTPDWLRRLEGELPALHQHSLEAARCEAGITCPRRVERCLGGQPR